MHTDFYGGNENSVVEHRGGDLRVVSSGSGWNLLVFVFMLRFLPVDCMFNF